MNETPTPSSKGNSQKIEDWLELYLIKKAPVQIPAAGRELLVQVLPWITIFSLLFVIFFIWGIISYRDAAQYVAATIFVGPKYSFFLYLAGAVLVVQAFLMITALPGLFKRQLKAWKLLVYATIAWFIYSLFHFVAFIPSLSSLLGIAISTTLGLYILFQVRGYYRS